MPSSEQLSSDYKTVYWYILYHGQPETIEVYLKDENRQRELLHQPSLEYIIPYLHLNKAKRQTTEDNKQPAACQSDIQLNNSLRNYLHYFVFIKASRMQLDILLSRPWNRGGLYHLFFRISHNGTPLRMREKDMLPLIKTLAEYQHKYSFREFNADTISSGTVRIIKKGAFMGRTATVLQVIRRGDGFSLTLGVPIFQKEFLVELYDFTSKDVEVLGGHIEKLFEPYFLQGVEQELLTFLDRRVRHLDDSHSRQTMKTRLQSYDTFRYLTFEDPVAQNHFQALLLLIATLQGDHERKALLLQAVKASLPSLDHPETEEQLFLLSILYVATRKGVYRKTVKDFVSHHPVTSPSLQRLLSLLKKINNR